MNKILYILPLLLALLVSVNADAKKKKYPNGDYYEGEWKKGQPNGIGIMIYASGDTYEGSWILGKFDGSGKMNYKNGNIYNGMWKNGKAHGDGILSCNNGNRYEGKWINGILISGKFIDYYNNIFEGTFEQNKSFHQGKMVKTNGDWYIGEWKNGRFLNGNCKGTLEGNFFFEGKIENGLPAFGIGKGNLHGNVYNGKWENGEFAGKCKLKYPSKNTLAISSFEGTVLSDSIMEGDVVYNNGDEYSGTLKYYKRDGEGLLKLKRIDTRIRGEWDNDLIIKGNGSCSYSKHFYTFTINEVQTNYNIIIQNRYQDKAAFQIIKSKDVNYIIKSINDVIKNKLSLLTRKHEQEIIDERIKAEDVKIQSILQTYRNENYRIGKFTHSPWGQPETQYVYRFDDVQYQYYESNNKRILHGKFHIWNGYRWLRHHYSRGGSKYSVKGTFYKGIKNGEWIYEEFIENRLARRLTVNYKMGKKNGLCTLERFGRRQGSRGIITAYYLDDVWNKHGTKYYYFNNEDEIYSYKVIDQETAGIFDAIGEFVNTHTSVDRKLEDVAERVLCFDDEGNLHGDIYLREGDMELNETYQHGKLLKSNLRNIKKGIVLSPKPGENRFKKMWKEILPADVNYNRDFLMELANLDLKEESSYNGPYKPEP